MITAKLAGDEAEKLPSLLPGLLHFVVMQYLGKDAALDDRPLPTNPAPSQVARP